MFGIRNHLRHLFTPAHHHFERWGRTRTLGSFRESPAANRQSLPAYKAAPLQAVWALLDPHRPGRHVVSEDRLR
jgi:hypothetical protein